MAIPSLAFMVQPVVGGDIVFQPSAPVSSTAKPTGRLMLCFGLNNTGPTTLILELVRLVFPGSSVATVAVSAMVPIASGQSAQYGFAKADDVILALPAPTTIRVELYVIGNGTPVTQTFTLRPFTDGPVLVPPFRACDLRDGEYVVTSRCSHAAGGLIGSQSFAYDIGVQYLAVGGGDERARLPHADASKNGNMRIWGLPVYAMASGTIVDVRRDVPTNPEPPLMKTNHFKTGQTTSGSGNYFVIDHGDGYVVQYAHMQIGSLPSELVKGICVVAGQLLGRVGNSGNSSGPHIHIDAKQGATNPSDGTTRPLVWSRGWVVGSATIAVSPASAWSKLKTQALPAVAGDAETNALVAWWPDELRPAAFATGRSEVALVGIPASNYQATVDDLAAAGYHLRLIRTAQIGGQLYFSVVARPAAGSHVAFHGAHPKDYEAKFKDLVGNQNYRLTCLHAYQAGGIRLAGVFRKTNGPPWFATGLRSASEHAAEIAKAKQTGFCPVSVSVVVDDDAHDRYSAIFEQRTVGAWSTDSVMAVNYQQRFDQAAQAGQRLAALDSHRHPLLGEMLDVVFHAKSPAGTAAHGLSADAVREACHRHRLDGRLTRALASYSGSNELRFAGLWS